MTRSVIDASALLAYLQGEAGAKEAAKYFKNAAISAVNLSEVFQKAIRIDRLPIVKAIVQQSGIEIVPFDAVIAEGTAELHARVEGKAVSLADRACIATAIQRKLPAVTADREWSSLDFPIDVILFR